MEIRRNTVKEIDPASDFHAMRSSGCCSVMVGVYLANGVSADFHQ